MSALASVPVAQATVSPAALQDRFLLTQVRSYTLVFPAAWVVEIFQIEKRHILELPFYSPLLLGLAHHNGRVLPLLDSYRLLTSESIALRETLTVIQLGEAAGKLAQVGFGVERALGNQPRQALPSSLFETPDPSTNSMVLLTPERVGSDLWQPLRWFPAASV